MNIQINVQRHHYEQAQMCGTKTPGWKKNGKLSDGPTQNCAIAYAIHDILPLSTVAVSYISNAHRVGKGIDKEEWIIELPRSATKMIHQFDNTSPEDRPSLPEFSFTIQIPDSVLRCIDISDILSGIKRSTHLKIVN